MSHFIFSDEKQKQMRKNLLSSLLFILIIVSFYSCTHSTANIEAPKKKISVGVFNGNGASAVCVLETMEALKIDSGISPREISAVDIMANELDNLDVIIFPGGSGSKENNNMGTLGADKVRAFGQQKGKGIIGICAGGYLLGSTPNYPNLGIVPLTHIREHYNRGRGLISFSMNEKGKELFPENKDFDSVYMQYYDGPIFNISDTSSVQVLATVNTDIATKKNDPFGVTPGKPAILSYTYGQGQIYIIIGHPEATHGMRWMVPRMARLSVNQAIISYHPELVKPDAYSKELLFIPELNKFEKDQFWNLSDEDPYAIIIALDHLKNLHSRPSIRWSIGLLRHHDVKVRIAAAEYLLYTEYTNALPDLKQAYENEQNKQAKKQLGEFYNRLNAYVQ